MSAHHRSCPSHAALHDAEAYLRTLDAYLGVLQGRLALARVSQRHAGLDRVMDGDLAVLVLQCERTTAALAAILTRISPELASSAAAIADVEQRRAYKQQRPRTAHLQVVKGDRSA